MKVKGLLATIIYLVVLSALLSACQSKGKAAVPDDLIGVWETTDPDYADRPFEITADEVIFVTGEESFDTYPITKIKIEKDLKEQKNLYVICYKNSARQEYKFSFYYDPANKGTIRFKNHRQMVWTKKPLSSASE